MNQQPGRLCAAGLFSFLCMGILMPALFKPSPWGPTPLIKGRCREATEGIGKVAGRKARRMRGQWKITLRLQRIPPSADGGLLCPRRFVVAMAQATFSWPFGPIHLESACLRFRLTAKTAPAPLLLLFPANPLRWASPGGTGEIHQNAAGVCSEEHRSGAPSRRTPDPITRDAYLLNFTKFPARKI